MPSWSHIIYSVNIRNMHCFVLLYHAKIPICCIVVAIWKVLYMLMFSGCVSKAPDVWTKTERANMQRTKSKLNQNCNQNFNKVFKISFFLLNLNLNLNLLTSRVKRQGMLQETYSHVSLFYHLFARTGVFSRGTTRHCVAPRFHSSHLSLFFSLTSQNCKLGGLPG